MMFYLSVPLVVPMIESLSQQGVAVMMRALEQMRPVP
jgi:hypothetical protein